MSGHSKQKNTAARRLLALGLALSLGAPVGAAQGERLKELVRVQGARSNQLLGYGLVVGLNQSGDDLTIAFTQQSLLALLRRMGTFSNVDPGRLLNTRDAAAVLVTALVPPFSRGGSQVDVTVAAAGNARSLQGGVLISTPLRGSDGRIYAVAQGPLLIGGLQASGYSGSVATRNHVTTGRIPEGAIVERDMPSGLRSDTLTLMLRSQDYSTAQRVSDAVTRAITGSPLAAAFQAGADKAVRALDAGTVEVQVPAALRERQVALTALLEGVEVEADTPARVVVNERTGVIVIGANVHLARAAVSQGRLTVRIDEQPAVVQPNPLAAGQTAVVAQTRVEQSESREPLRAVGPAAKVEDVVATLNQLGLATRELIAVLQALKAVGALHGELVIE